jgi:hypothetical protein
MWRERGWSNTGQYRIKKKSSKEETLALGSISLCGEQYDSYGDEC